MNDWKPDKGDIFLLLLAAGIMSVMAILCAVAVVLTMTGWWGNGTGSW